LPVRTDGLGIIDCGDYSAIREYSILNLVTEGGSSYICRKAHCLGKALPVLPNNRTEYWVLAARKGSDVQMRVTDSAVQWCIVGQDWADLIQLSEGRRWLTRRERLLSGFTANEFPRCS
jgi:hypothetical protein